MSDHPVPFKMVELNGADSAPLKSKMNDVTKVFCTDSVSFLPVLLHALEWATSFLTATSKMQRRTFSAKLRIRP